VLPNEGAEAPKAGVDVAPKAGAGVEPNAGADWAPKAGVVEPNGWLPKDACVCPNAGEPKILACGWLVPNPPKGDAGFWPNIGAPDPNAGAEDEAPKAPEEAPNVVGCVAPNTPVAVPLPKREEPVCPPNGVVLPKGFAPNRLLDWFIPKGLVVVPKGFEAAGDAPNGELLDDAPKAERQMTRIKHQFCITFKLTLLVLQ
jgi:hypothetical protein